MIKIDTTGLHPLYDQYENAENRLTHALLHTIGSSRWIFENFLNKLIGINSRIRGSQFEIATQKVPFSHGDKETNKVESIPDAWITDNASKIGIAIEVKDRKDSIRTGQLRRHARRIRGYERPYLVVITPDIQEPEKIRQLRIDDSPGLNIELLTEICG